MAIKGLVGGVNIFLPTLLILTFLGNEDKLGIIAGCTSLLSALFLYIIAKKLKVQQRFLLFAIGLSTLLVGAVIFSLTYSAIGVLCFNIMQGLANQPVWIGINSLTYDLIDHEQAQNNDSHYAYLCDREFYLNLGRVIAIILFLGVVALFSAELAMRFSMLVLAGTQFFMLVLIGKVDWIPYANSQSQ
jgi:MFS transporter, YQGE family, putative transporter